MPSPVLRYPLDKTGINPDNFVNNESHILQVLNVRAIAPTYGAYFTESLQIRDTTTNLTLVRGTQYICTELLDTATEIYGKEICYLILITDPLVSNSVSIKYQALGGPYTRSADAIVSLYNLITNDTRPINWQSIINKPGTFSPSQHLHDLGDIYGFEYLVNSLERIRSAILLADVPANENMLAWITDSLNEIRQSFQAQINQLVGSNVLTPAISSLANNNITRQSDGLFVARIDPNISSDSGNILQRNPDGLFVPDVLPAISTTLGNTLQRNPDGLFNAPTLPDISQNAGNILQRNPDGLFVPTNTGVLGAPVGGIIMYDGLVANLPINWKVCDGTGGTPNLTDKFIIGASVTKPLGAVGGSADAVVVNHAHTSSATFTGDVLPNHTHAVSDPGHNHSYSSTIDPYVGGPYSLDDRGAVTSNTTGVAYTGITIAGSPSGTPTGTVTVSVTNTGVSDVDKNLPPYYALMYIKRIF